MLYEGSGAEDRLPYLSLHAVFVYERGQLIHADASPIPPFRSQISHVDNSRRSRANRPLQHVLPRTCRGEGHAILERCVGIGKANPGLLASGL